MSARLQLASTFCNLKLQTVSILQPTLSKTEIGQIESTSLLAEVIKSRFLSFESVVPKYHLLHKCVYLFTGYDAVKCEHFSVYARGSIPDRSYGQTMSQFCGQRCRKSPVLSCRFSWVIATYYISIIINGLVMYKITFSRHLCWGLSCCTTWFTHFYDFKYTRNT